MSFIKFIKQELFIIATCIIIIALTWFYWLPYLGEGSVFCSSKGSCTSGVGFVFGLTTIAIIGAIWSIVHKWRNGV